MRQCGLQDLVRARVTRRRLEPAREGRVGVGWPKAERHLQLRGECPAGVLQILDGGRQLVTGDLRTEYVLQRDAARGVLLPGQRFKVPNEPQRFPLNSDRLFEGLESVVRGLHRES